MAILYNWWSKMNKKEYLFILGGAAGGGYSQVIPMEEVSTMSPLRSLWVIISTLRGSNDDALFYYTLLKVHFSLKNNRNLQCHIVNSFLVIHLV